jgi:hypothetical protein
MPEIDYEALVKQAEQEGASWLTSTAPRGLAAPQLDPQHKVLGIPLKSLMMARQQKKTRGEEIEAVGPGIGEAVGAVAGGPLGAAFGAGAGAAVSQAIQGKPVDPQEVLIETALSFLPEAGEALVRRGGRALLRMTRGGHEVLSDEAARRAGRAAQAIFEAPEKQAVSQMFDAVEQSGARVSPAPVQEFLRALPEARVRDLLLLDIQPIDRAMRSERQFTPLLRQWANPQVEGELPRLADLEALRRHVRDRAAQSPDPAAKRLLYGLRDSLEESIMRTPLQGGDESVRELLSQARRQWAQVMSAEELSTLLGSSPVSRVTKQGQMLEFHLDRLLNLLRDNRTPRAQSVNRGLAVTPGAQERFVAFVDEMRDVLPGSVLSITDTAGLRRFAPVAAADRMVSHLITSERGQAMLREYMTQKPGPISVQAIALMVNTLRRETMAEQASSPALESIPGSPSVPFR